MKTSVKKSDRTQEKGNFALTNTWMIRLAIVLFAVIFCLCIYEEKGELSGRVQRMMGFYHEEMTVISPAKGLQLAALINRSGINLRHHQRPNLISFEFVYETMNGRIIPSSSVLFRKPLRIYSQKTQFGMVAVPGPAQNGISGNDLK